MMSLFDLLRTTDYDMNTDKLSDGEGERWFAGIKGAMPIKIDNVAEYFFQDVKTYAHWCFSDFPTLTLPFDKIWMEFNGSTQRKLLSEVGVTSAKPYPKTGVLLQQNQISIWEYNQVVAPEERMPASIDRDEQGWLIEVTLFHLSDELTNDIEIPISISFAVDASGAASSNRVHWQPFCSEDEARASIRGGIYPALLAVSLMHCKNVKWIENLPSMKVNKKRIKFGKPPTLKYYTLQIEPMRQVLKREGQSETLGLKRAMHICRGHFKDYRNSGLFGKVKGIFWWDSNVRGNLSEGAVVKDYAIKV